MGAGSIGLGVIAALSARGAQHVIAVEPSPRRREMAVQLGAALALHPDEANPVEIWREHAGAQAPLVVWECTGKAGMINKIMHLVPPQTRIMVDGSCMVDDTIRPIVGTYKGLLIDFGYGPVTDAYVISLSASGQVLSTHCHSSPPRSASTMLARPLTGCPTRMSTSRSS